jgi:hypothetical protein
MTIRAKKAVSCVYVVMKGSLTMEWKLARDRIGRIHTVWTSMQDAQDEVDWNIDRETLVSGQQTNGYWIDTRGVVTSVQ